jgi:hypothetical protein
MVPLLPRWPANCQPDGMVIGPLINLASGFIQSLFQGSSGTQEANQRSPFAQVLGNLDQSSLTHSQHAAQRIASHLHTGAQSATANATAALANQLTQLSTEITNASASGRTLNF